MRARAPRPRCRRTSRRQDVWESHQKRAVGVFGQGDRISHRRLLRSRSCHSRLISSPDGLLQPELLLNRGDEASAQLPALAVHRQD